MVLGIVSSLSCCRCLRLWYSLPLLLVVSAADQVLEAGALEGTKGRWLDMLHGRPEQSRFGNVALVMAERKHELGGETR